MAEVGELLDVLGETGAETTEGEGGSDDDGETNLLGGIDGLLEGGGCGGLGALLANLLHRLGEELSILGRDNSLDRGTEHLDAELGKLILELDTDTEAVWPPNVQ